MLLWSEEVTLTVGADARAVGERFRAEVGLVTVLVGLALAAGPLELGDGLSSGGSRGEADQGDGEGEDDGLEGGHDDECGFGVCRWRDLPVFDGGL